jgi:Putative transposase
VATLTVVMSRAAGGELKVGVGAVIQTAGRASNDNPHVQMMVTGGGIDEQGQWQDVKTVSNDYLHREWPRQLFARLEETSRSAELAQLLKRLGQEDNRGLVASWEPKPVKTGKGLARYLIKYVASPPMAVCRIIASDGQSVEYCWQDDKSHQQERARVSAAEFIRRLVQHILPRGFQRVRYYGLHDVSNRGRNRSRGCTKYGRQRLDSGAQSNYALRRCGATSISQSKTGNALQRRCAQFCCRFSSKGGYC